MIVAVIVVIAFMLILIAVVRRRRKSRKQRELTKRTVRSSPVSAARIRHKKNDALTENVPKRFRNGTRGIVRNLAFGESFKKREYTIGFRLEIIDDDGNVTELIPVEARAEEIPSNVMTEGDRVILIGSKNRKGVMITKHVFDITTNSEIKFGESDIVAGTVGAVIHLLNIVFWIGFWVSLIGGLAGGAFIGIPLAILCFIGGIICVRKIRRRGLDFQ